MAETEKSKETAGSAKAEGQILAVSGINKAPINAVGKTVGELRGQLKKVLGISEGAVAMVDGVVIDPSQETTFVVQAGSTIEFIKESGQKGI
jgi:hypothetical protein